MVTVNWEKVEAVGKNLAEYLEKNNFDIKKIAVEINGDIVPKSKYSETLLQEGDKVEVVSFVGGGWNDTHKRWNVFGAY